ncbi:MAG TPA: response regulator [Bradyrhizobium sp.]|jgi:FixJ family two-component response regulator|nr:response regulator [Bradyrhizobium sp.]
MTDDSPIVAVIDDDLSVRESIQGLLETAALRVELFASPREYVQARRKDNPSCIILDVRLPGSSGLDFQRELAAAGIRAPIIFITGYADVPMSVQAMKAGAVEFLTKPYRDQALLDAVLSAIEKDQQRRTEERALADIHRRFEALTPRERQVMALTVSGQQSKQIAGEVGIREVTVRVHRREIMRKMSAKSLADLVKMGEALRNRGVTLSPDPLIDE